MKKNIALFLALGMCITILAGCTESESNDSNVSVDESNFAVENTDVMISNGEEKLVREEFEEISDSEQGENFSVTGNSDDAEIQSEESEYAENSSAVNESEESLSVESTPAESSFEGSTSEENSSTIDTPVESAFSQPSSFESNADQYQYVTSLDEIPDEALKNMRDKAEEGIYDYCEGEYGKEAHVDGIEYIGCVFSTSKNTADTGNIIDIALKVSLTMDRDNHDSQNYIYYTYFRFENAMILADGTFSMDYTCTITMNPLVLYAGNIASYLVKGYKSLDALITDDITNRMESYNIVSTI